MLLVTLDSVCAAHHYVRYPSANTNVRLQGCRLNGDRDATAELGGALNERQRSDWSKLHFFEMSVELFFY